MLRLHNTLSGKLEDFAPTESGAVKMFVCGPTVYDFSHLGHAKTYTQFDFIARFLRYSGYKLNYLQNITDIDDKIIRRAAEKNIDPADLASEYEKYYLEDMKALNNTNVDKYARARDYIPQIVSQVERLLEKGFAYKISDGYYFDIKSFKDYGKLSGRTALMAEDAVSRIDENPEKRNPGDFCLWKFRKDADPYWETKIGEGRPGWHIEDTAITEHELGSQYDIHGGARDLIFPHHEAEIAQMEAVSGKVPFVKYWLHTGFLTTKSEKMSKSLGNFTTIRDVFTNGISPFGLRYLFLGVHYRSPANFSWEGLQASQNALDKLRHFMPSLVQASPEGILNGNIHAEYKSEFVSCMENDFNTPEALAVLWKLVKDESIDPADKFATIMDFDRVLGLQIYSGKVEIPAEVQKLVAERDKARKAKDFKKSDELRDLIKEKGFEVKDTDGGQALHKI